MSVVRVREGVGRASGGRRGGAARRAGARLRGGAREEDVGGAVERRQLRVRQVAEKRDGQRRVRFLSVRLETLARGAVAGDDQVDGELPLVSLHDARAVLDR